MDGEDKKVLALARKYTDSQLIDAGDVTGVKGDAEETYRAGKVNITPNNIGSYSKSDTDTLLGNKVDKVEGKGLSENDYTTAEKTKLTGISENATKTEASLTNGNIKIDGTETNVYDDSEIKQDLSTDTATVSGNPLNFTTLTAQKAKQTVISLEPIQDLHGYDHPWPAGGGKNKLPMTVDGIKAANTDGIWTGNIYTINNVSYELLTDSDGNMIGIKATASGTVSANSNLIIIFGASGLFETGEIMNGCPAGGGISTYKLSCWSAGRANEDRGSGVTLTQGTYENVSINIYSGLSIPTAGLLFQPMIRLATETDATFAPYSNICPIDGRTETSLGGCGVNQWDEELEIGDIDGQGVPTESTTLIRTKHFNPCKPNTTFRVIKPNTPMYMKYYDGDKNFISPSTIAGDTITTPTNCYFFKFVMGSAYGTTYNNDISINYPATDTDYHPYTPSNNLTIQFGETVYGATFTMETGELVVDTKYDVYDGSVDEEWTYNSSSDAFYITTGIISGNKLNGISNLFPTIGSSSSFGIRFGGGENDSRIFCYKMVTTISDVTDLATWRTYLSNNNLQVCYPLPTPTIIHLTPNEISLLSGVNNISTDGDSISLTYRDGKVATLGDLTATNENVETNTNSIQSILANFAPMEITNKASQNYVQDSFFVYNDKLYKTTQAIASGETITEGTNCTETTVAEQIIALFGALS